jgi:hypothetical protein
LKDLKSTMPDLALSEGKYPMVECSSWADYAKDRGATFLRDWHFEDRPYLDEKENLSDYSFVTPEHTLSEALKSLDMWMKHEPGWN